MLDGSEYRFIHQTKCCSCTERIGKKTRI